MGDVCHKMPLLIAYSSFSPFPKILIGFALIPVRFKGSNFQRHPLPAIRNCPVNKRMTSTAPRSLIADSCNIGWLHQTLLFNSKKTTASIAYSMLQQGKPYTPNCLLSNENLPQCLVITAIASLPWIINH